MSDHERLAELRQFLKERRARLGPADVGLPLTGRRRVRGLRREEVASLAGIGVSWYTALENGDARNVSEATLLAVAGALRLSDSEREYLVALAGPAPAHHIPVTASPLVIMTLGAIAFPAYIITADWMVLDCNEPFRRVWAISAREAPFNAFERLFMHPASRAMHGTNFAENVRPVIAMLHSSLGRQPHAAGLRALRDRLLTDSTLQTIWNAFEISSPLTPNACTIASAIGPFRYESVTLPVSNTYGIVVQVPDLASRERLNAPTADALRATTVSDIVIPAGEAYAAELEMS